MKVGEGSYWLTQKKVPSRSPALEPSSWNKIIKTQSIPKEPIAQASAYEACDRMCMPLHMPETLETCKKKAHLWFEKLQAVWQIARLKQQRFFLSLSI